MAPRGIYIGQKVRIPWGLDKVLGEIRGIYGPAGHPFAIVALESFGRDSDLTSDDEELEATISVPVSELEAV